MMIVPKRESFFGFYHGGRAQPLQAESLMLSPQHFQLEALNVSDGGKDFSLTS